MNPLLDIDLYKADHRSQYPEGTEYVYSNLTARSDKHYPEVKGESVFFGLQAWVKEYLQDTWNKEFFYRPKEAVVDEYKYFMDKVLGEGAVTVDHIADLWELSYLPVRIKALPEGSLVPIGVPYLTVENTVPRFFWVTNYLETVLSSDLWKTIMSATTANLYRKILEKYAVQTGAENWFVDFQAHDFSFRGMSGRHDARMSGMGHLVSFKGTDSLPAVQAIEEYYPPKTTEIVGASVPATEHSVMMMGSKEGEFDTFKRLITKVYPKGIVSIVSDTWDFWKVITEFLPKLKDDIEARDGKVVIRPDSGDPVEIICGKDIYDISGYLNFDYGMDDLEVIIAEEIADKVSDNTPHGEIGPTEVEEIFLAHGVYYLAKAEIEYNRYDKQYYFIEGCTAEVERVELTPEQKGAVKCLWEIFGGDITNKGYRQLSSKIGLIYGDSITLDRAEKILSRLEKNGFSSDNIVFGVGSYTYQHKTRDSLGIAMKATWGQVKGDPRIIFKDPVTDDGTKKSLRGRIHVGIDSKGKYFASDNLNQDLPHNKLEDVFLDGKLVHEYSIEDVRNNLKIHNIMGTK